MENALLLHFFGCVDTAALQELPQIIRRKVYLYLTYLTAQNVPSVYLYYWHQVGAGEKISL